MTARLVPEMPLPPYTFVPGRSPHPLSHPAGHSYGVHPAVPPPPDPERWYECKPYLYGMDLFNGGYFWEAHEAWERLWLACGRRGWLADLLKGLIQLAVAGVKAYEGRPVGVRSHALRAAELFRQVAGEREYQASSRMGLDLPALAESALRLAAAAGDDGATLVELMPVLGDGDR